MRRVVRCGRVAGLALVLISSLREARGESLVDLYLKARESDPTFRQAEYQLQISDEILLEARAGLLPVVDGTAERLRTYQDVSDTESFLFQEGKRDFDTTNWTVSLTQPVYRSAAIRRMPQARAEVRQAEAVFSASEQDLMFRLTQAEFNHMAARDNLEFNTAERMANYRQLLETEERIRSGLATITDLHDARARFSLSEAAESLAKDTLEDARQALMEITGFAPGDPPRLSESFPFIPPDNPDVQAWVESAMFQNYTIRARIEAQEIARLEVSRQRAAYFPTLDLVASYNDRDTEGTVFGGGNQTVTTDISLRLGVPIWEGGRRSALTSAAALRESISTEDLEREKRRVDRETRAAFHGVTNGIERVNALRTSVFSNERAVASKEEGFRSGINTGLVVLDARRDLYSALKDLAQARYLYVLNSVKLKQSTGTLSVSDLRQIDTHLQ
jgi:outer membrane protein